MRDLYLMTQLLQEAYLILTHLFNKVLTDESELRHFYINNYINSDQYNILYYENFINFKKKQTDEMSNKMQS